MQSLWCARACVCACVCVCVCVCEQWGLGDWGSDHKFWDKSEIDLCLTSPKISAQVGTGSEELILFLGGRARNCWVTCPQILGAEVRFCFPEIIKNRSIRASVRALCNLYVPCRSRARAHVCVCVRACVRACVCGTFPLRTCLRVLWSQCSNCGLSGRLFTGSSRPCLTTVTTEL